MATTEADNKKEADEFYAGYAEDHQQTQQDDDAAFGLTPEEAPGAGEPAGSAPAVAIAVDPAPAADGKAPAPAAPADEAAATPAPALDIDKETQRLKSWEGRLKVQAAELAAKAKEESTEPAAEKAQEAATGEDGDDADLKALTEDFGPDFVTMLTAVITKMAKKCAVAAATEHTAPYRKDIDAVIAELRNDKERAHYEKIVDAHPDFMDIANSPAFQSWLDGLDPEQKTEAERVATNGNAKEVIAMLKQYKATLAPADDTSKTDDAMASAIDHAEGVRSTGGLKLPDAPAGAASFDDAWDERP